MSSQHSSTSTADPYDVELVTNKQHNGNYFLKVLLLSNKVNKNKWVVPYKKISELPKTLIDSYKGLAYTNRHDNLRFDKIWLDMTREGKSLDDIYNKYLEVTKDIAIGHVDHVYTDEDGELLYGQVEVTDPDENEYIREYGEPRLKYTSPGMHGVYDLLPCGTMQYRPETAKAFHIAAVKNPAFDETEAAVKGVCDKGNSLLCRPQYASLEDEPMPEIDPPLSSTENLNTNPNNINSIMSTNIPNNIPPSENGEKVPTDNKGEVLREFQKEDQYKPTTGLEDKAKEHFNKSKQESEEDQAPSKQDNEKEVRKQVQEELELKEMKAELARVKKEKEEQADFILSELINTHVPRSLFKKDEEFEAETNNFKGFLKKYGINYNDAKWFITKAYGKPEGKESNGKEDNKKSNPQYAGIGSTIFSTDSLTSSGSTDFESKPSGTYRPDIPIEF